MNAVFSTLLTKRTGQEAVQLHKELDVRVLALWSLAVRVPHMMGVQIDACIHKSSANQSSPVADLMLIEDKRSQGLDGNVIDVPILTMLCAVPAVG